MGSQGVRHDWAAFTSLHFLDSTHQSWPSGSSFLESHLQSCSSFLSAAFYTKVPCEEENWEFGRFGGWSRGKIQSWELVTQQVSLDGGWTGLHERGSLWQHETIQRCMAWRLPPKGRRPREHPGEKKVGKGVTYLSDVTQDQSGEFLSQRVPRATPVWSLTTTRLSYQWLADVGWVLQICKAYRLWMANNLLVWVILKLTEGIPWRYSG